MDEEFLAMALQLMGEEGVQSIKVRGPNPFVVTIFSVVWLWLVFAGDKEQVHRWAGLVRIHQLRQRSSGPHGHAQAERENHTE